ncbi:17-beta-hydroxysteroid dehydrogenase type 2 [Ochotona princeps]|uniref:17-beta-hydroxysteroid dehydrogenase type 2 n=1 Tax=Ochotona princeps TaxID=9978 RepID=UPI0001778B8B|nr:17-beta-hydroxysteroid dehydrogenase type 2 [Ochotona princeps]
MSVFCCLTSWLCLAAAAALVATVLSKYKRSPEQVGNQVVCLALGLWAVVCLASLSLFWGFTLFCLSCFLMYTYLSEQVWLPVGQKAVLVTGSDCGFGHEICKHLDKMGFTVFAGVLNEQGSGAEELRRHCSSRLSVLQMDVTKPEQVKDAHSKVTEKVKDKGLWAVINNAGIIGFPADGELIPMNEYKKCMAVNFFGAVHVTKTFLPLLRKSKGRLVNISSMGAGVPMEKLSCYSSAKAALTMFSSVMRQELSKWGVKVAIIQPGGFQTKIMGTSDAWEKHEKNIMEQLPGEVLEDYGEDYILTMKNFLINIQTVASPDFSPLILDVQHALCAKHPSAFYSPGKMVFLWLCVASILPTSLYDYIWKKHSGSPGHMPRALSLPNGNKAM